MDFIGPWEGWAEPRTYRHVCLISDPLLVDNTRDLLSRCQCVCVWCSLQAYSTVPKYIRFSGSCQREATICRTPTVACGTVIFVNATPATFWKGPLLTDMVNSACFALYFQDTASEKKKKNPDPEAISRHYQIRNESQANSQSGCMPSVNCLQKRGA